ncbi:hypothetical protein ACQKLX_12120 [Bosea sp. NPDC003192]|uniref:hypothetical protein n=1 Tax=Bosea sp. NPDC003192 TaxID=3390551 RepID=UPI003CFE9AFD
MLIALVIIAAAHLVIASFVALNSILEAERDRFAAKDILIIALVGAAWPAIGCVLLAAQIYRTLVPGKRAFLRMVR